MATPFGMGPAWQPNGTNNPEMITAVANTGSAIYLGSILGLSSNILVALATTPTAGVIVGVAGAPVGGAPGFNMGNQPTVVTWRVATVPYYKASVNTMYISHLVNGSDVNIAPALGDVGLLYGIRVKADGEVAVDKALTTTNARVVIRKIDIPNNYVLWNFLSTAISQ